MGDYLAKPVKDKQKEDSEIKEVRLYFINI